MTPRPADPSADRPADRPAVVETRVIHEVHRRATALLAGAVTDPSVPPAELAELRDFVVAMLQHHHVSEDRELWPLLTAAAPRLADELDGLSLEHQGLDAALADLAAAPLGAAGAAGAGQVALAVRDGLHQHLAHEEPVLFPALRAYVPDEAWDAFSRHTVESAPLEGTHLLVGLIHDVATPAEVELVLRHLPPEARALVPALREQAAASRVLASFRS